MAAQLREKKGVWGGAGRLLAIQAQDQEGGPEAVQRPQRAQTAESPHPGEGGEGGG